jgi:hypothetical protein
MHIISCIGTCVVTIALHMIFLPRDEFQFQLDFAEFLALQLLLFCLQDYLLAWGWEI